MAPAGLIVEERADRWHVTLNRPEVRNAIDQDMVDAFHEAEVLHLLGADNADEGEHRPDGKVDVSCHDEHDHAHGQDEDVTVLHDEVGDVLRA